MRINSWNKIEKIIWVFLFFINLRLFNSLLSLEDFCLSISIIVYCEEILRVVFDGSGKIS